MPPVYGKDKFSDCRKLCDPDEGYWQSCKDLCEGIYSFEFTKIPTVLSSTPKPTIQPSTSTVLSSTPTPTIQSSTPIVPFSTSTLTIPAPAASTASDAILSESNDDVNTLTYILIGTVLTFITGLLLYCLRKRLFILLQNILQWSRRRFCKTAEGSKKEVPIQPPTEMKQLKTVEESERLLSETDQNCTKINKNPTNKSAAGKTHNTVKTKKALFNNGNIASDPVNKQGFSSPKSLGIDKGETDGEVGENLPNTDTSPVHYDDGKFYVISHDADERNDNGETDSESESETDSGIVQTDTRNVETIADDNVSKRAVKKKGVVRVITEINLR